MYSQLQIPRVTNLSHNRATKSHRYTDRTSREKTPNHHGTYIPHIGSPEWSLIFNYISSNISQILHKCHFIKIFRKWIATNPRPKLSNTNFKLVVKFYQNLILNSHTWQLIIYNIYKLHIPTYIKDRHILQAIGTNVSSPFILLRIKRIWKFNNFKPANKKPKA